MTKVLLPAAVTRTRRSGVVKAPTSCRHLGSIQMSPTPPVSRDFTNVQNRAQEVPPSASRKSGVLTSDTIWQLPTKLQASAPISQLEENIVLSPPPAEPQANQTKEGKGTEEKGVRSSPNGSILNLGSAFRLTRTWARERAAALQGGCPGQGNEDRIWVTRRQG